MGVEASKIAQHEEACAHGDLEECHELALAWLEASVVAGEEGRVKDEAEAVEKAAKALNNACFRSPGHGESCYLLAGMYYDGDGVPVSKKQARALCARGCELGHGESCFNEGSMAMYGVGGEEDKGLALDRYVSACHSGVSRACFNLGLALEDRMDEGEEGLGERVAALFEKACGEGIPEACTSWAMVLEQGKGVEADVGKARRLLRDACEDGGDGDACFNLAVIFSSLAQREEGLGEEEKREAAAAAGAYFGMACDLGLDSACDAAQYYAEFGPL